MDQRKSSVNPACLEGMFRDATAAIRSGACAQRHGKFRERHVERQGAVALVS